MIGRVLAALSVLCAAAVFAEPVDVNRATLAQIEAVRGIGPSIAAALIDERGKAPFSDWADLIGRVKGMGAANAARMSAEGLTVNGSVFTPPQARPKKK